MIYKLFTLLVCFTISSAQYIDLYLDLPNDIPHDGYGGISRDGWEARNAVHRASVHSAMLKAEHDRVHSVQRQFENSQEEFRKSMYVPPYSSTTDILSTTSITSEPYFAKLPEVDSITSFHSSFSPTPSAYYAMIY